MDDIAQRLLDQGKDAFSRQYSLGMFKLCYEAATEIDRLRNRVAVLEMVIGEELYGCDCSDDANRMIVDEINDRRSPAAPATGFHDDR